MTESPHQKKQVCLESTSTLKRHYSYLWGTQNYPLSQVTLSTSHQLPYHVISTNNYLLDPIIHNPTIYILQPISNHIHTPTLRHTTIIENHSGIYFQNFEFSLFNHPFQPIPFWNYFSCSLLSLLSSHSSLYFPSGIVRTHHIKTTGIITSRNVPFSVGPTQLYTGSQMLPHPCVNVLKSPAAF